MLTTRMVMGMLAAASVIAAGCGASVDLGGLSSCLADEDVGHAVAGAPVDALEEELEVNQVLITDDERITVVLANTRQEENAVLERFKRYLTRRAPSWIGDEGIPRDEDFVVEGNSIVHYPLGTETADAKAVQRCIGLSPDPDLADIDPDVHRGEDVVAVLTEQGFHVFEDNRRYELITEDLREQTLEKVSWYTTTVLGKGYNETEGQMQVFVMDSPEAAEQLETSQRGADGQLEIPEGSVLYLREGNVLVKYYVRAPNGTEWTDLSDALQAALDLLQSTNGEGVGGEPTEEEVEAAVEKKQEAVEEAAEASDAKPKGKQNG